MSRWITITPDHLKAAGHGTIMDRAQTLAVGGIDPIVDAIANATARVRRAVAAGNILDIDTTKVPESFKGVTEKLAIYDLMERIGLALTPAQEQKMRDITSDLNRTADNRTKVETPDTPAASGEMQPTPSPAISPRRRRFTWRDEQGA